MATTTTSRRPKLKGRATTTSSATTSSKAFNRAPDYVQVVGAVEAAKRFGVQPQTMHTWRMRGVLPEPRWIASNNPVWDYAELDAWAKGQGKALVAKGRGYTSAAPRAGAQMLDLGGGSKSAAPKTAKGANRARPLTAQRRGRAKGS